jgi:hypothetical protein
VVVVLAGEHRSDGEVDGGGRLFGWWWSLPERAPGMKLVCGIDEREQERVSGRVLAVVVV